MSHVIPNYYDFFFQGKKVKVGSEHWKGVEKMAKNNNNK